jgi:hypothetical protein
LNCTTDAPSQARPWLRRKDVIKMICSSLLMLAAMGMRGGATDKSDPEAWLREVELDYDRD